MEEGARYLHVVDLDAAMGVGDNLSVVAEILANVRIGVEVGGGIRSIGRAGEILAMGADRIILGTAAIRNPELILELVERVGSDRVMVALDARAGKVVIEGWRTLTEKTVIGMARRFQQMKVGSLLFTSVDAEGQMRGAAVDAIRELVQAVKLPVIAAGGVASLDDVRAVRDTGAAGLVIGTALYEGRFSLKRAMEVAK
jgi:phosphoribosylformimino-5-aminoimidazole carboxamide ribotide isomerase